MSEYTFLHHLQGTHTHTRTHRYSFFQASPSWILPKMPPRAAPLLLPCLILAGSRCDLQSQPLLGYPAVPRCRFFSCLADAKPQSALCAQWDPGNTAGPGLVKAASTPNTLAAARLFSAIQTDSPSGHGRLPVYASPLCVKQVPEIWGVVLPNQKILTLNQLNCLSHLRCQLC